MEEAATAAAVGVGRRSLYTDFCPLGCLHERTGSC